MYALEVIVMIVGLIVSGVVGWVGLQIRRYLKAVESMQPPKCHEKEKP